MGFGSAFKEAFLQVDDQIYQSRRDKARFYMDNHTANKKTRDAAEAAAEARIEKAHILATAIGKPEAWTYAEEYLRADISEDNIMKMLSSRTFEPFADVETPETASEANPVDQQTDQATAIQSAPADAAVNTDIDLLGNPLGPQGLFNPERIKAQEDNRAQSEVAGMVGQEEYDAANTPFTPEPIAHEVNMQPLEAKATNPLDEFFGDNLLTEDRFNTVDAQIEAIRNSKKPEDVEAVERWDALKPVLEASMEEEDDGTILTPEAIQFSKALDDALVPVIEKRVNVINMSNAAAELYYIAEDQQDVLTMVGALKNSISELGTEAGALGGWANEIINSGGSQESIQKTVDAILGPMSADPTHNRYREFMSSALNLAYMSAAAKGSSGQTLSDKELQLNLDAILAGNSLPTLLANLTNMVKRNASQYDTYLEETVQGGAILQLGMEDERAKAIIEGQTSVTSAMKKNHLDTYTLFWGAEEGERVDEGEKLRYGVPFILDEHNMAIGKHTIFKGFEIGDIVIVQDKTGKVVLYNGNLGE